MLKEPDNGPNDNRITSIIPGIKVDSDLAEKLTAFAKDATKEEQRANVLDEVKLLMRDMSEYEKSEYVQRLIGIIYEAEDLVENLHKFYRNFIETGGLPGKPIQPGSLASGFMIRSSPEEYVVELPPEETNRINSEIALAESLLASNQGDSLVEVLTHFIYGQAMFYAYLQREIKARYNDVLQ